MTRHLFLLALPAVLLMSAAHAEAADVGLVDGLRVMRKVEERYQGDDRQEAMRLLLSRTSKEGENLVTTLEVRWLQKEFGNEDRVVVHFIAPKFATGVTLLNIVKPYVDDERWVFFPEGPIIRKVQASDEHSNFMGTDFTYYDLSDREPDEENHHLRGIEEFQGLKCYVVETTPKGPVGAGYSKKVYWIDSERFLKLRIDYFDSKGRPSKRYDTYDWREINRIWVPLKVTMEDFTRGHRTVIERSNVQYNKGVSSDFFQPQFVDCILFKDGAFSLLPFEQRPTRVLEKGAAGGARPARPIPVGGPVPPQGPGQPSIGRE